MGEKKTYLELDFVPSLNDEAFDRELQDLIGAHADTKITTILSRFVPASVAAEIADLAGAAEMYAQGFPKEKRGAFPLPDISDAPLPHPAVEKDSEQGS